MLALSTQTKRIGWMQIMLLKTWLAEAEGKLQGLVPSRQPKCLVALENEDLIALVVFQPNNRRGSCWAISFPEFIKEPQKTSKRDICKKLLRKAIELENSIAKNWVVRVPAINMDQLSVCRELGFQPLKKLKLWQYKLIRIEEIEKHVYPKNIYWENLSKANAKSLFQLKKSSESVQLRELLDIQWLDLLDKNQPTNGILINKTTDSTKTILGLITPLCAEDPLSLELVRDLAWDSRLEKVLPKTLCDLKQKQPYISVETSSDDKELTNLLAIINWQQQSEIVILGRSILKRNINTQLTNRKNSLKSILNGLKPSQEPLPRPTPILDAK